MPGSSRSLRLLRQESGPGGTRAYRKGEAEQASLVSNVVCSTAMSEFEDPDLSPRTLTPGQQTLCVCVFKLFKDSFSS